MSDALDNAQAQLAHGAVDVADARRCEMLHITPATGTILRRLVSTQNALRDLIAEHERYKRDAIAEVERVQALYQGALNRIEDLRPASPTDDEREAARRAVASVLWNAGNYPERVQVRLLGQNVDPLVTMVVDAFIAAGFRRQGPVTVTRDMVEKAAERMHMRASGFEGRKAWADTTDRIRQGWRDAAHDALTATLSPDGNTEGNDR